MSTTLTYGHKLPADGDKGSTFFDDLESNIALDDSHNHNGTNSSLLTTSAFSNTTGAISSASWTAVSGKDGLYRQLVTLPSGLTLGARGIFFIDSSGNYYILTVEQVTSTTYYVYINDNSLDLTAIYV
jgi:hypothetical protein